VKRAVCHFLLLLVTGVPAFGQITNADDVARILAQALTRASELVARELVADPHSGKTNPVVAVVDREGFVLGVRSLYPEPQPLNVLDAITKAGTAAFLSSDQNAFSSRTAGFIVQQHFPPAIRNRPPGPLVGVNFSNMSFSDVNRFKDPSTYDSMAWGGGGTNGAPITLGPAALSGLAGSPGGVPLYKNGKLIGGVGATVFDIPNPPTNIPALSDIQMKAKQTADPDEDAALAGQIGFEPARSLLGSQVFIDGIRVPYVNTTTRLDTNVLLMGTNVFATTNSPHVAYPLLTLGNVAGEMRAPIIGDPMTNQIDGVCRLKAWEVTNILMLAAQRAAITRAGIRLPRGQAAQVFISVVNNPDQAGQAPVVLGTFRTGTSSNIAGATIFSWDVCVQKARTALYFSSTNRAYSSRTVGFLAESLYPPGIVGTSPGPYLSLQEKFSLLPVGVTNLLNGVVFTNMMAAPDPNLPNGITIFPGGFPLYRCGKLIGAIGVSGDGVDQDDIIAASGTVHFLAPASIRADQFVFRGARLPYAKFPRNPSL
jgi:uncharacterized protein GlcG (DUF336 family)